MTKETVDNRKNKVSELKSKIRELEQANLLLQEYFSLTSFGGVSVLEGSPYDNSHKFSSSISIVIDLTLQKIVKYHIQNGQFGLRKFNFFLKEINYFVVKVLAAPDRKKFRNLIELFSQNRILVNQSIIRLGTLPETWAFVCFEKVTYPNHSNDFLHVLFIPMDEKKELNSELREFVKHSEKEEKYQRIENLTVRQREIFVLLGKGLTSKEIAHQLNISFHTVEAHRKSIAKKTQTRKRAALISLAAEIGI
jgi:DNA-binding CsgD family transcriptional regulator